MNQYRIDTKDTPMICYNKMAYFIDNEFGGEASCTAYSPEETNHIINEGDGRKITFGTVHYYIMIRQLCSDSLWVSFQRKYETRPKHLDKHFREILKKMGYAEIRKF